MNKQKLNAWLRRAQDEIRALTRIVQEKGPKHFARPLAVSFGVIYLTYRFWFQVTAGELRKVQADLAAAKATDKYADKYKDAKNRLDIFYASLPNAKDRGTWLTETVREQLKAEGITALTFSAVDEKEFGGYILASLTVTCRATYRQTASWIARMERHRYILHVSNLAMQKDASEIGANVINMTITTVLSRDSGGGAT